MKEMDIEEREILEQTSYDEEVFQSELPKKLLQANEVFTNMIKHLPRDEFGDFIYKGSDIDDVPSQKLRDFAARYQ